nr:adenylyl sulfate kinase-like protein [Streptomyces sp. WAC 04229]
MMLSARIRFSICRRYTGDRHRLGTAGPAADIPGSTRAESDAVAPRLDERLKETSLYMI